MTPYQIAAIYRSGDLPFRPRYLNRLFALRWASRSVANAICVAREMPNEPTREKFEIELLIYIQSPVAWLYHEVLVKRRQPLSRFAEAAR